MVTRVSSNIASRHDPYLTLMFLLMLPLTQLDAVALLIDHDASMDVVDREGMRPIHVICASLDQLENGPGIVHYLLHRG